ncbi:zf-HC2 domain-containing protein [Pedobacter lithocola]|uniref:Zf-HC2 domain-containing protein n=1 Tax=Pedobacter lithocola TaxID=1908239 RepID=A0ABV8PCY9_9SPHI
MTGALKKIIYNCKQATLLIEKRTLGNITASEALQLQVHLAGCSLCRTYQKQSMLIIRLFTGFPSDVIKLDDTFKVKIQQQIEKEMNKN